MEFRIRLADNVLFLRAKSFYEVGLKNNKAPPLTEKANSWQGSVCRLSECHSFATLLPALLGKIFYAAEAGGFCRITLAIPLRRLWISTQWPFEERLSVGLMRRRNAVGTRGSGDPLIECSNSIKGCCAWPSCAMPHAGNHEQPNRDFCFSPQ